MFELTNEQRIYFALSPVSDTWTKLEVTPGKYDMYYTFAYLDGNVIKKVIQVFDEQPGHDLYREFCVEAELSDDHKRILPKTEKGKQKPFSTANLEKCKRIGMELSYVRGSVSLSNLTNEVTYYHSVYEGQVIRSLSQFSDWVSRWCNETTEADLKEIQAFAQQGKVHQKYREGDFFRFRINRRLFGYGRIMVDYEQMRKQEIPFWDIFMGKPLCVAVYHIATENPSLTPDDLRGLKLLPSQMIMDNIFYYGECKIIGNAEITPEEENYTIHYGTSISGLDGFSGLRYQSGKTYIAANDQEVLYNGFINNGISFALEIKLPTLLACIEQDSNDPYWQNVSPNSWNKDLRNPIYKEQLHQIRRQLGLES